MSAPRPVQGTARVRGHPTLVYYEWCHRKDDTLSTARHGDLTQGRHQLGTEVRRRRVAFMKSSTVASKSPYLRITAPQRNVAENAVGHVCARVWSAVSKDQLSLRVYG